MIDSVLALDNALRRSVECYRMGNHSQAELLCREILAYRPNHPNTLHQLGLVAFQLGREDAESLIRRAIAIDPYDSHYRSNLGMVLEAKGEPEAARACYEQALAMAPDDAAAHGNLALNLLRRGNFTDGFREFEWREKDGRLSSSHQQFPRPQWRGEPLAGRTVLLHHEQGFGDTIQFVRYARLIREREPDAPVIVGCQPELNTLLKNSLPDVRVVSPGEVLPAFDVYCLMLSLPRVCGTVSVEAIPGSGYHYLTADPRKTVYWRERLGNDGNTFKVGLAWAGSPLRPLGYNRSMTLAEMTPLGSVSGVSFYSLQTGEAARQARAGDSPFPIQDGSGELHDFDDTAALVSSLDLVITVDTAVAHLAGALGKPAWVFLPYVADWRWLTGRADSPWYPAMRLFRQTQPGQWAGVVEHVRDELQRIDVHRVRSIG